MGSSQFASSVDFTGSSQFTSSASSADGKTQAGAIPLREDVWTNGNIAPSEEQWFRFTATAGMQYFHVAFGTLSNLYIQVYDNAGNVAGGNSNLYGSTQSASRPLIPGQVYFIRVWSNIGSGTYTILFNRYPTLPITLPAFGITDLTENTWTDNGFLENGDQWFRFTANSNTQYIHAIFGTLNSYYGITVQVYNSIGYAIGEQSNIIGSAAYISRALIPGQIYYIRVWPWSSSYTGTYQIGFNTCFLPPGTSITQLAADTFANGSLASGGTEWFSLTANSSTQYIHAAFGTLNSSYGVLMQVYTEGGTTTGSQSRLYSGTVYDSRTLTVGQVYYIKVTPYNNSYTGTYQIGFNTALWPPDTSILTANAWKSGSLVSDGIQWFRFTANSNTQYIHAAFGTLDSSYGALMQVYAGDGTSVESQSRLYSGALYVSRTLTAGQEYYVKVTPYNNSYTGTYQIGFNAGFLPPGTSITSLTANTFANGSLAAGGVQWFSFTATAAAQYIHAAFGTLDSSYGALMQVYAGDGASVESQSRLYSGALYVSRTLTVGQVYYVKVTPYNNSYTGTYQIGFNAGFLPPGTSVTPLTVNTFAGGSIASGGAEWFSFTATAATQYIHAAFGTLNSSYGVYMQVYAGDGTSVESQSRLYSGTAYASRTLTVGQEYYVKVTPYNNSYTGTYQIGFNAGFLPPGTSVTPLTVNTFAGGSIASGGAEWFSFTATAAAQYIHATYGTLADLYVQVLNQSGTVLTGTREGGNTSTTPNLYGSYTWASYTLTEGQTYYLRVWPYYSSSSGTYQIAFNASSLPPFQSGEVFPPINPVALSADSWANGSLASGGYQWFRLTANSGTQYIHAAFGTLSSSYGVYMQMYDESGTAVGNQSKLDSSTLYAAQTVTSGRVYYIRVWNGTSSGTYQMAYTTTHWPPGTSITPLTADTFANGSLASGGTQGFSFTATAVTQYIHVAFGTLTALRVQVYDQAGTAVGSQSVYSSTAYDSRTLTVGQVYYVRVTPYDNSYTGTYQIGFNASFLPPGGAAILTANVWENGSIASYGAQWFSFTATAATQYIHVTYGTLTDLYIQVLNQSGTVLTGTEKGGTTSTTPNLYESYTWASYTLTEGQTYYLRVWPYNSSNSGTYQIAFNTSSTPPP
jgi:hypothetical protein